MIRTYQAVRNSLQAQNSDCKIEKPLIIFKSKKMSFSRGIAEGSLVTGLKIKGLLYEPGNIKRNVEK